MITELRTERNGVGIPTELGTENLDLNGRKQMPPRLTLVRTKEGGVELWFNEAGKALLMSEIGQLGESNDHLHMSTSNDSADINLSDIPYRPSDQVIGEMKLLFRTDDWDRKYFQHVITEGARITDYGAV
jgi:hypothetical protein